MHNPRHALRKWRWRAENSRASAATRFFMLLCTRNCYCCSIVIHWQSIEIAQIVAPAHSTMFCLSVREIFLQLCLHSKSFLAAQHETTTNKRKFQRHFQNINSSRTQPTTTKRKISVFLCLFRYFTICEMCFIHDLSQQNSQK